MIPSNVSELGFRGLVATGVVRVIEKDVEEVKSLLDTAVRYRQRACENVKSHVEQDGPEKQWDKVSLVIHLGRRVINPQRSEVPCTWRPLVESNRIENTTKGESLRERLTGW